MKLLWLFCLIFLNNSVNIDCVEEFVTLWAPQTFYDTKDYNVVLLSNNIDKRTEIALQFRRSYGTMALTSDKVQKVRISNPNKSGSKTKFDLIMTLHRNETGSTGQRHMCMTQTLQEIQAEKKNFYTFIQTDKPIYKPGDDVRFRIIVVDRDLKPYHMNNININVTDSLNRPIKVFDDLGESYLGVFTQNFSLSGNTPLGIWKIRAVIDKMEQWESFKLFAVSKYTLPPFAAYIQLKDQHLLTNSILKLSFYAKYSFEDFVRGNAQLTITCTTNGQVVVSKTFNDIANIHTVKYKAQDDLKAKTRTKLDYLATVVFTDSESGISANKSIKFTVHADNSPKIEPNHPAKFMPGLPFGFKVSVYDWTGKLIESTPERVIIKLECRLQNGEIRTDVFDGVIKRGVAIVNALIPEDTDELTVKIQYLLVEYEKKIEKGAILVGINKISVDYLPKLPNYNDNVTVQIRGDSEIDQLIGIVMSRHGNIESHQVHCSYRVHCKFNFTVKKDMMPQAKVVVYHINNKVSISQGEVNITTAELSRNTLDIDMPESAQTKKSINVTITTQPYSTVYLLAYDERLTYLFQGNDVKKDDVVKELADYDGTNKVTVFHVNKTNWHQCTKKELERIQKGRSFVVQHSTDQFSANQDDEIVEDIEDLESSRNPDEDAHPPADDVREDFREVFIFDELEVDHTGVMRKKYITLDSITSWMISSFSMNEESGLAIGPPKKLKVKNQFFTKIVLPYSIRFKEKLRIDVMVYNYVDSQEPLDVTVKMWNGAAKNDEMKEFRFYDTECSTTASTATSMSKTVKVPYDYAKKVSFFIQSGADRTEYAEMLKIRIDANGITSNGHKFVDKILKKLRVEPIGVKVYDIDVKNHILNKSSAPKIDTLKKNVTNGDEYPKFTVEIAGDYMTDDMTKVNLGYEIYPDHCLEQRTSLIKGNVEHFRYLKSKNANPSTTHFSAYYQSTLQQRVRNWNYATSSGYRAYFIEAIASAMEIGALPRNPPIIEKELNLLQIQQTSSGNFNNFGSIPSNRDQYFQTAYILIPFLKFRNYVNKNYDAVINKGFSYLNGITSGSPSDMESYSIAAYAYALHGNHETAKSLLKQTVDHKKEIARTKHCLKKSIDADCNIVHTSYAVIAYLTMNMTREAKPFSAWIMDSYKTNKYYSNTYTYAVAAEAISKFLIAYPLNLITDFTVTLTNEMDFNKVIHVTKDNQKNEIEVLYPDYTLAPSMSIQGSGFCSITKITERTVALTRSSSKFTLSVTTQATSLKNEKIVKVCATYQPKDEDISMETIFNVIYDVELPSGYIYKEIVNLSSKPEIKLAAPRLQNTRVQIFYDGFTRNKNYCVEVAATKYFDVKDVQNAGVMVYDYNQKNNVAIDFYKFTNPC
ncbi:thioester-containing protein 1 allele S3-like isoform X1 [Chironomus tepperi]|uniref:thioester-containing protein 1 allele S3-like isoform X1 n=1 Tax=Chironomus tepperi TaxID=113505 RepID=UPI00391F2201